MEPPSERFAVNDTCPANPAGPAPARVRPLDWMAALILALALNFVLFGLMPGLIDEEAPGPIFASKPQPVRILRMNRPVPMKKKRAVSQKPKKVRTRRPVQRHVAVNPPAAPENLTLNFELAPSVPVMATDISLPAMAEVSLPAFDPSHEFLPGDLDRQPRVRVQIPPVYPLHAKRRGIQGRVRVGFLVTDRGEVADIRILKAEPPGIFEASVRRCVSSWRFEPGRVAGKPVNTQVETTIRYELK